MKIVMLTNEFAPSIGGVQTHVLELSRALVKAGHEVHVVTRFKNKQLPAREKLDGIEVHRIALAKNHWLYDWQMRRYLRRLHNLGGVDVVHVHGMRPLAAAGSLGVRVVFTNHTSGFLKRMEAGADVRTKMAGQMSVADCVLAPSEELAQRTRDTGYSGPVRFVANGVDTKKFFPGESPWRAKLNIPADAFVLVMARRLVAKNGVLYLAEALQHITATGVHIVVAGDGAERGEFERIAAGAAAGVKVHMLGGVDNTQMPDVFRAGNAAVLPSLMEATSIAGLEAMACGNALIGTRVGGIPVIIDDQTTGLLVPPRDPKALASAIDRLAGDLKFAHMLGRASVAKVEREFSWTRIAELTAEAYAN
ncbi:glycosyltransferase family 4 protein [Simiduia sp. 21SJ11W-1]|uniref:glycosyltransferase family 4 protein n=1 Tax=Simiduia sp. 21SJ11W-1 TaxID=2909669 RepID=UPI00209FC1C8|nr:glycosyltransferase family 4 protein [Simiduia sp. 21SJ11W-1]UTA48006.1 glycosyltransferase family 4 protein [Simiduia sp. 21SJ11W-1]